MRLKRKASAPLADDVASLTCDNLRLREQNEHLKAKVRRLVQQPTVAPPTLTIHPRVQQSCLNAASQTMCGPEEIEDPSGESPAVRTLNSAPAPPPVGLGHLLTFLSIVLHMYDSMLPASLALRLLAVLPESSMEENTSPSEEGKDATAERPLCSKDATIQDQDEDNIVASWQHLLSQRKTTLREMNVVAAALRTARGVTYRDCDIIDTAMTSSL